MSTSNETPRKVQTDDEDEPDEWDKRIFSTGCSGTYTAPNRAPAAFHAGSNFYTAEQTKMNDCYFEKKDWRLCKQEMENFRECWKRRGNDQRTETKDA
ncbi:hypothetical protein MMC08_003889 [Hypocenomyce scalaris]|nr:hypothetical protein [Hypocenomyce scalaris]